jgi:hypothetical protein
VVEVNVAYLIVVVLVGFGALGVWRGWLREVATLAGLLVAWMAVVAVGGALIDLTNRVSLMVTFTLRGGFDSRAPDVLLQTLRQNPAVDPRRPELFLGLLFGALALLAFLAASRFAVPSRSLAGRALGALLGLANGYLVAYLGLRYFLPAARVNLPIVANAAQVDDVLGRYLSTLLVVGVIVAIGIALLSSGRLSARGSRGASRAKSRPGEA